MFRTGASDASTSISYDFAKSLRITQTDLFFLLKIEIELLLSITARNFSRTAFSAFSEPALLRRIFNHPTKFVF
ncbi:MAG: hypothetical protein ACW986_06825 [Promethearchaeota archaeon]